MACAPRMQVIPPLTRNTEDCHIPPKCIPFTPPYNDACSRPLTPNIFFVDLCAKTCGQCKSGDSSSGFSRVKPAVMGEWMKGMSDKVGDVMRDAMSGMGGETHHSPSGRRLLSTSSTSPYSSTSTHIQNLCEGTGYANISSFAELLIASQSASCFLVCKSLPYTLNSALLGDS